MQKNVGYENLREKATPNRAMFYPIADIATSQLDTVMPLYRLTLTASLYVIIIYYVVLHCTCFI